MLFLTFNIYLFYLKLKTNLKLQIYEKKNIYIPLFFFLYFILFIPISYHTDLLYC